MTAPDVQTPGGNLASADQTKDDADIVADAARRDKRLANTQARAALLGLELRWCDDDRGVPLYVLTRWALTKHFSSVDAIEEWLDRFEGKARRA